LVDVGLLVCPLNHILESMLIQSWLSSQCNRVLFGSEQLTVCFLTISRVWLMDNLIIILLDVDVDVDVDGGMAVRG